MNGDKGQLNIAMIGHKTIPSRTGGVEVVVESLATNMAKKGHKVTLFNRKRKKVKGVEKLTEYNGCKIEEAFTVERRSLDAFVYAYFVTKKVKKMAKKGMFDVLHYHAEGPCAFLNKLPKKGKRNFKLVVTVHGIDWKRGKWKGLGTKVLKRCEEQIVKHADEIIVLSKANAEHFMTTYNKQTTLIPNGVNIPALRSANLIKEKWGLEKDDYLLTVARIVPEKGIHYLVNAWKQVVKETKTNKKLVIAGGYAQSRDYYNEIVEACKGEDSIILAGFTTGELLEELFSNAYLFVLPSDLEGMAMSLLEAQSYGNTCLVSDIPENVAVIYGKDYTFRHSDERDLAEKIKEILDKNLETHQTQHQPYKWEDIADRTLELYRKD